jgi:hypothetical protein
MANRKSTKGQTMIYKILCRKLKIRKQEPHNEKEGQLDSLVKSKNKSNVFFTTFDFSFMLDSVLNQTTP